MKCVKCHREIPEGSAYCNLCGKKQKETVRRSRVRGNGEGTVYQLPNGKWRAEKTFGYTIGANDRQIRIYRTKSGFKTKREALAYLPQLKPKDPALARKLGGADSQCDMTLKELYDIWFAQHEASEKAMGSYRSSFKIFKPVWDAKMRSITIDDLQECFDDFVPTKNGTNGFRAKQVAKSCLNLVYRYGIPRGYIRNSVSGEANLASFLKVGKSEAVAKDGISMSELETVRQAIGSVPYADYIYCHCYLGFRPTALLALQVKDYNAEERYFIGGIKTEAGRNRIVTVSPKILPIVERLVSGKKQTDYVFSDPKGKQLTSEQYRDLFYKALAAVGIQPLQDSGRYRLTPHSCRHTFSTLMKSIDAPTKDKLRLIGHTDETMMRYYQDVDLDDLRRITDSL